MLTLIPDSDRYFLFVIYAHDCSVQIYFYACFFSLSEKLFPDFKTAFFSMMLFGAEEFVNLFEKLSAGACIFIKYNYIHTCLSSLYSSGETCRSGADNYQFMSFHLFFASHASRVSTPYCVCTSMPSSNIVMQVRTLGCPFTIITQSVHLPIAQNIPRGLCCFAV